MCHVEIGGMYSSTRHQQANRFLPQQISILAQLFPFENIIDANGSLDDLEQLTDCWVGSKRVMLRVITGPAITFRCTQHSNEIDKVRHGIGDYYLCCWREGWDITDWKLMSLGRLRAWLAMGNQLEYRAGSWDQDHGFYCFWTDEAVAAGELLGHPIILAEKMPV